MMWLLWLPSLGTLLNFIFKTEPVYTMAIVAATIWDHIKNFIIKLEPVYAVAIVTANI